jgi:hypothetical protein
VYVLSDLLVSGKGLNTFCAVCVAQRIRTELWHGGSGWMLLRYGESLCSFHARRVQVHLEHMESFREHSKSCREHLESLGEHMESFRDQSRGLGASQRSKELEMILPELARRLSY